MQEQNQIQRAGGQVSATAQTGLRKFNDVIQFPKTQDYLHKVLGSKAEAFITSVTSLVANDYKLQTCEPMTLVYAATKAAALSLPFDPNLGMAYCIPYNNRKRGVTEAQFQIGYKGFIQLALRSGQFSRLNVTDVREGELIGYDMLTGDVTLKAAENREQLPVVGYAAYFRLTNGFEKTLYWTRAACETHGMRYSQTFASRSAEVRGSSKWVTDFDAMCKKTVIKQLLTKFAPMSVDMQTAQLADQAVIRGEGEQYDYADNANTGINDHNDINDLAAVAAAAVAEESEAENDSNEDNANKDVKDINDQAETEAAATTEENSEAESNAPLFGGTIKRAK